MNIIELIEIIRQDKDCVIKSPETTLSLPDNLPEDLKTFFELTNERKGQCYDSFHETHGMEGDSAIIATNFTELLLNLYKSKGQYWF